MLVDGGVAIAGLTVQVDDLGVIAPLDRLATPSAWGLDLRGLAVALQAGPVSLAGGLVKRQGPPIDYAGIVNVEVAGKGFSAVGAYGRPSDAAGAYTSLFVFVALPFVIGGPPYLFVTGLGGGAGYNRRLIPPADVTAVAGYPLITAIDGGLVSDPMKALDQLGSAMPPKRGSLWLAAGVRFTSFALVETTAVAYVSLDRGVEVGVLGLSRAAIPDKTRALAAVELAIKARFSADEGVLSVQAQLTDHSWLLSKDCQLTGGFAFFIWFPRGQFVLTLGGYHPAFAKPPEFPVVPRLGFHWAVSDSVTIKGESYFALTSSCVMAGGRLEAGYKSGGIEASFVVFADFLISWDPFHYDISAGVTVSAGFHKRICFFACVTIDVHISIGASVHILGPPLHGEAKVDLEICSVTVRFGPQAAPPPSFIGWDQFVARYVVAGAQDASAVSAHAGPGPPRAGVRHGAGASGELARRAVALRRRLLPAHGDAHAGHGLHGDRQVRSAAAQRGPGDARRRADERGRRHGHAHRHGDDSRQAPPSTSARSRSRPPSARCRPPCGASSTIPSPTRRCQNALHRHDDRRRLAAGRGQPMGRTGSRR